MGAAELVMCVCVALSGVWRCARERIVACRCESSSLLIEALGGLPSLRDETQSIVMTRRQVDLAWLSAHRARRRMLLLLGGAKLVAVFARALSVFRRQG